MNNTRFSVAIHILSLAATESQKNLTSAYIAGSVNTHPVVIRRITGLLKKANIIASNTGSAGMTITKSLDNMTLLDIYQAVEPEDSLFAIHEKPNPQCPVGSRIQATLEDTFSAAQQAMEQELAATSLRDVITQLSA